MSKRYQGNIISATPQVPENNYQDTPASGVWGIYEVEDLIKRGLWPTLGNINPDKFVENIFSTYLYAGNSSNRSITNNIDLSTEGGLVWIKGRTSTAYNFNNTLFDTERGAGYRIHTDLKSAQGYNNNTLTSFNTDGFGLGTDGTVLVNWSSNDYVSWTFRKAPKFFDVVTYTGNDTAGHTISHNLGSTPGMIIVKPTSVSNTNWVVYHRSNGAGKYMWLQETDAVYSDTTRWNNTDPTATEFTLGAAGDTNYGGREYVAYLFAHNDGDGDFGTTGDQDIIKCGSYTGTGASGNSVDLGFEPQWLMIKRTNSTGNWLLYDVMRGLPNDGGVGAAQELAANTDNIERDNREGPIPLSNGFGLNTTSSSVNGTNDNYIYIAIRRGPMAVPESATDVFNIDTRTAVSSISGTDPSFSASFPADMAIYRTVDTTANNLIASRLTQSKLMYANLTNAESTSTNGVYYFDKENGWFSTTSSDSDSYSWMWGRAPNFFDVVAYTGDGSGDITLNHNLGVDPEMLWVKGRNITSAWHVAHKNDFSKYLRLETTDAYINFRVLESSSSTQFTLDSFFNASGQSWVAHLFASLDGISKVGSYTGDGNTEQNIDCGFTNGSRFVLIKKASNTGSWFLFDAERGIISGNSPYLQLNQNSTESSAYNELSPYSSGFTVRNGGGLNLNFNGHTFVFYAIA
jgi:hypothetical protein